MEGQNSDVYEKLIGAALRFVSYRPRSEKEVRDFLTKKLAKSHTSAPSVLLQVLERLRDLGYVDDKAFSEWWVGQRTGRKPKGEASIVRELGQKGIPKELARETIAGIMQGDKSERELACVLARKKVNTWSNKPLIEQKQKLSQFLMRRGFSSDTVWSVVDEILENG